MYSETGEAGARLTCPNGCEAGWLRGNRPCSCATAQGSGGHDRWDCAGCVYTHVVGCVDPSRQGRVIAYRGPSGSSEGMRSDELGRPMRLDPASRRWDVWNGAGWQPAPYPM